MKNFIIRWLGPPDIEGLSARIAALENRQAQLESDKNIRITIGAAVRDAIEGTNHDYWGYHKDMHEQFVNALRRAAENCLFAVEGKVRDKGLKVISETINTEKFIDEIVTRIKSKQLGG